jgi:hypothetical protein
MHLHVKTRSLCVKHDYCYRPAQTVRCWESYASVLRRRPHRTRATPRWTSAALCSLGGFLDRFAHGGRPPNSYRSLLPGLARAAHRLRRKQDQSTISSRAYSGSKPNSAGCALFSAAAMHFQSASRPRWEGGGCGKPKRTSLGGIVTNRSSPNHALKTWGKLRTSSSTLQSAPMPLLHYFGGPLT